MFVLILPAGSARKNRFYCSKLCSDTLILLEFCSVSEKKKKKFSALWAVFIFANVEGSLGLTPEK